MKLLLILAAVSASWALPEIDPKLQNLSAGATANIMVTISNRTDSVLATITAQLFATRGDRLNAVHDALLAHATLTQAEVIAAMAPFGTLISFVSYWVSNQIFIKGATALLIEVLSVLPSVSKIEAEFFIALGSPTGERVEINSKQKGTNTYGVVKIQAPDVWSLGYTGQGVLVANIDTGVRGSHQALTGRFLGKYGWYDPNLFTQSPNDQDGHGTHSMGTMTGTGGIGVAPGAKWAACKGCNLGTCSNNALTACGQFFTCPTDGILFPTKDCTKAPHVINNSWGGAGNSSWYNDIIKAWQAAGIIGVFSSGNSGPDCGTLVSPGDQNLTITVGATDANDALASYSSVGPPGNGLLKPDLVGPGSNVISSYFTSDTAYQSMSGTSMSSPHVAGVVALLKSKNMTLTYQNIYNALTQNCDQSSLLGIGQTCGGRSDSEWPNYSFGWGRVNALRAIKTV